MRRRNSGFLHVARPSPALVTWVARAEASGEAVTRFSSTGAIFSAIAEEEDRTLLASRREAVSCTTGSGSWSAAHGAVGRIAQPRFAPPRT